MPQIHGARDDLQLGLRVIKLLEMQTSLSTLSHREPCFKTLCAILPEMPLFPQHTVSFSCSDRSRLVSAFWPPSFVPTVQVWSGQQEEPRSCAERPVGQDSGRRLRSALPLPGVADTWEEVGNPTGVQLRRGVHADCLENWRIISFVFALS